MKFNAVMAGSLASLFVSATMLTACGGGGSSDGAPTPSPPPSAGGNLATSVPAPTYAAGSTQLAMFNQLNDVRLKGGFGMLAQDAALDKAATNHANYLLSNYYLGKSNWDNSGLSKVDPTTGWPGAHFESSGGIGFTGNTPGNRAVAAGVAYRFVDEVVAFVGDGCIVSLLNTVFHRSGILNSDVQSVGMSNTKSADGLGFSCVINPGYKLNPSERPSGWMGVYPGNSQIDVPVGMPLGEAPDPAPSIPNANKGQPVSIYLNGTLSKVNAFTLTAAGTSSSVPAVLLINTTFPLYLTKQEAHILPSQVLASKTVYNVNFSAAMTDGTTVNKAWSFTTQ